MITNFIIAICCLFLGVKEVDNVTNLHGDTCRISDGDVSIFDGSEIKNGTLVIAEGNYLLQVKKEGGACLKVGDNTELVIDGTLRLTPNPFKSYDIIRVVGRHVNIHGKGSIVGDRSEHTGHEGEWGMGIRMKASSDVRINGLTIADCWGDCIYVGGGSKNTQISNCQLRGSRRQGISITNADSVTIRNCRIENISGTNPQYAIDIEPNKQCVVDNVLIKNVTVTGCKGGIRAILGKKTYGNARIGKVEIRNCRLSAKSRHTIQLAGCEQAVVEGCLIETRKGQKPVISRKVGRLTVKNNRRIKVKS